ncbi:MAG: hypothetical protein IPL40_15820 [Proteobacteria bacterium]|nr:hypothetical protein [Pseudomonadota bacterium]
MPGYRGMPALFVGALLAAGCGASAADGPLRRAVANPIAGVDGASRCDVRGKRLVQLDLNEDRQPDVWKLYVTRIAGGAKIDTLACKERDLNFDGRKDSWSLYDDEGNLATEQIDLDFDGSVDLVTHRRGGKLVRQELDSNHDGKTDVWRHYEDNVLARVERDTNGDGRIDYWEYHEGGQLDRIGYDRDGDGRVDAWDRAPSQPGGPASTPGESAEPEVSE